MASAFSFGGTVTRRPTVRALINDLALIPLGSGQLPVVVLIGTAEGGEPGVPEPFISPSRATARVRGGDLKIGIERAYIGGATTIYTVRVNPATRATKTFPDAAAADSIVVNSANWGVRDNSNWLSIATGSIAGSKKLTLGVGPTTALVKDNLYRNVLSIQYIGLGTAAAMTINTTALTVDVTGGGGEDLSAAFTDFQTARDLVAYIDSQEMYTCTLVDPNPENLTLGVFDFVTAVDIKTAAVTATATLDEIVRWLNSSAQNLVTATRATGAGLPPANVTTTYLAGGTEGTVTADSWQAAIDSLETWTNAAYLVPLTSDATYHGKVLTHVIAMSQDGRRPRRAFVGAALGEKNATLSAYLARAAALNSDRMALVIQGFSPETPSGQILTQQAPCFLAAQVAGMQSALPVGEPLTQKPFSTISRLEWVPTRAELEIGLAGQLLMIEQDESRGGFRISRGLSTWLANDAFHRVEISTGVAVDTVVRDLIFALDPFLGRKASPDVLAQIASATVSQLKTEERNGVIVGDVAHPAFQAVVVELQGDAVYVECQISPVIPLNFIALTLHCVPYTGTISITTGV